MTILCGIPIDAGICDQRCGAPPTFAGPILSRKSPRDIGRCRLRCPPSGGLGSVAVDHIVNVTGNARRLIAVLTCCLRDSKHLVGEADKRHRTPMSRAISSPKPTSFGIQDLRGLY